MACRTSPLFFTYLHVYFNYTLLILEKGKSMIHLTPPSTTITAGITTDSVNDRTVHANNNNGRKD